VRGGRNTCPACRFLRLRACSVPRRRRAEDAPDLRFDVRQTSIVTHVQRRLMRCDRQSVSQSVTLGRQHVGANVQRILTSDRRRRRQRVILVLRGVVLSPSSIWLVSRHITSRHDTTRSTCRACRAVLFDKLDTAKMHGFDSLHVSCRVDMGRDEPR